MLRQWQSTKDLLARARDWLTRFQRWRCTEETRRALAAIDPDQLDQLSETGRQVRKDALRRLEMDRLSSNPSS
jgi:hypothetical protein